MKGGYKAKICGTTNMEDVRLSADEGADFFGVVVEVDFSPRSQTIGDAGRLFAAPPIPGVALVFKMKEERVATMIQTLNPFAVQFLDPADISMLKRLKRAHPSVEMWQSIHLPQAGEEADLVCKVEGRTELERSGHHEVPGRRAQAALQNNRF